MHYDFLLCVQDFVIDTRFRRLVCSVKGPHH